MGILKGACVVAQSGGPTSVINASTYGIIQTALECGDITGVYGAANGIKGILTETMYDMAEERPGELELLRITPSAALGSCRYKLVDPDKDDTDYKRILEVFEKYNIRYFFYNGGNDSMDTCNKVSKYLRESGYECRIIGVPKTIDNDLYGTDHCPGYGSAAKYIATSCAEISLDARVYDAPQVTILEVMGRHTGWLTAASILARGSSHGPDLIYLPEIPFSIDRFVSDVDNVCSKSNNCVVAVSEGIKDHEGNFISALSHRDSFGHAQLGGLAGILSGIIRDKMRIKVRGIEFSLLQRCAAHIASLTDVDEAFMCGKAAVLAAVDGESDKMVGIERIQNGRYSSRTTLVDLESVANRERHVPIEWISGSLNDLSDEFFFYALPLIQGEVAPILSNGLPRFSHLKKIPVSI